MQIELNKRKTITMKNKLSYWILPLLILIAAFSRIISHPVNVTPIAAMGLFGAAYFNRKILAYLVPLAALFASDLVINNTILASYFGHFTIFYPGALFVYGGFTLISLLGFALLKKVKFSNVIIGSILASGIFFIISNLGTFFTGIMYPHTWAGLVICYTAALPYFANTILGDLFFVGVLFGGFELIKIGVPALAKEYKQI